MKDFGDPFVLWDFYWDTKYRRAMIGIRFERDRYVVLCEGFDVGDLFQIWPDKTAKHMRTVGGSRNLEKREMPSRELVEKAFGDLSDELEASKRRSLS